MFLINGSDLLFQLINGVMQEARVALESQHAQDRSQEMEIIRLFLKMARQNMIDILSSTLVSLQLAFSKERIYLTEESIKKAQENLSFLVDQIKEVRLSNLESLLSNADNFADTIRPINFTEVVKEALVSVRTHATRNKVNISLDCPENLPRIYGNRDFLVLMLKNLLNNAIKYNNYGGLT